MPGRRMVEGLASRRRGDYQRGVGKKAGETSPRHPLKAHTCSERLSVTAGACCSDNVKARSRSDDLGYPARQGQTGSDYCRNQALSQAIPLWGDNR